MKNKAIDITMLPNAELDKILAKKEVLVKICEQKIEPKFSQHNKSAAERFIKLMKLLPANNFKQIGVEECDYTRYYIFQN